MGLKLTLEKWITPGSGLSCVILIKIGIKDEVKVESFIFILKTFKFFSGRSTGKGLNDIRTMPVRKGLGCKYSDFPGCPGRGLAP